MMPQVTIPQRCKAEQKLAAYLSVKQVARQVGLSPSSVRRYMQRGLIHKELSEGEIAQLHRIRHLTQLGVNLQGVEIILHMRGQIEDLEDEVALMKAVLTQELA